MMESKNIELWVFAKWDEDHEVYYSDSNIPGLNIEAETLGDFEDAMFDIAPELIFENIIKPALEADGIDCKFIEGGVSVKLGSKPKARMPICEIPEQVPFTWRGSAPRNINLAMA